MNIQDALDYIGYIDNGAGQICQLDKGKATLILFEFGCPSCSEVAPKNADEWGEALETIVNAAHSMYPELERLRKMRAASIKLADAAQEFFNQKGWKAAPELADALTAYGHGESRGWSVGP